MQRNTNRRDFLKRASLWTAAVGSGIISSGCSRSGDSPKPAGTPGIASQPNTAVEEAPSDTLQQELVAIVDTHQHLWDLKIVRLPWLEKDTAKPIRKSYLTSDYLEATKGLNVVKAVYMEVNVAATDQDKEAEYVIDLCRRDDNPTVAAVIGGSPQHKQFKDYITKYAESPYVKGVRTVLHDPDRPQGMCLKPQFVENIKLLGELGLRYDLCMRAGEVVDGVKLVEQCPKTRFVIDHCGNMDVQSTDKKLREQWMQGMKGLAEHENVVCKISGIIVTADKDSWKPDDLAPNVNYCLETFGEDRVIFAGDWPVCTLTASYREWVNALKQIVRDRSPEFQRKLFHDNAMKFYELT